MHGVKNSHLCHTQEQVGVRGCLIMLIFLLLRYASNAHHYATKNLTLSQHYAHRQGPKVTSIKTTSCTHDRSL